MKFLDAGESHGKVLSAIIEGFPAHVKVDFTLLDWLIKKRQGGYGRGGRMEIEKDSVQILSGVRNGITLGSPITLQIINKDWENWENIMDVKSGKGAELTLPRPGHADLNGMQKYRFKDGRNILERSSARETAIRTAVGGFGIILLNELGIRVMSHVTSIGNIEAQNFDIDYENLPKYHYDTPLYCLDSNATEHMIKLIERTKTLGDTLGGTFELIVTGVPPGIGSHVHWDRKLDGKIAGALMSIQGIKGIEFGIGKEGCKKPGSKFHDEIFYDNKRGLYRKTNNCGGIEGGMSNGSPIVVKCFMKPIPTLMKPLKSVDIITREEKTASVERSDVCGVPAAAIVAKSVIAFEIANAIVHQFGGDTMMDIKDRFNHYKDRCKEL